MALTALTQAEVDSANRGFLPKGFGTRLARIDSIPRLKRSWAAPAAASSTNVAAATTLANGAVTNLTGTSILAQPDFPRVLRVVGNQASAVGNVVVTGTDEWGNVIEDTIVANGTTVVNGVKAFETITAIQLPARGASGDTLSVGFGAALGLGERLLGDTVQYALVDGVWETTRPTVTANSTDAAKNVISFNTAPNGSRNFVAVWDDLRSLSEETIPE